MLGGGGDAGSDAWNDRIDDADGRRAALLHSAHELSGLRYSGIARRGHRPRGARRLQPGRRGALLHRRRRRSRPRSSAPCARRDEVALELETLKQDLPGDAPHELSALLDVHLMLLHDEALTGATKQWIIERHYNAEWALSAQLEVLARQFDEMEDEYLRERKADLEQVVERILGALAREQGKSPIDAASLVQRDFAGDRSAAAGGRRHRPGRHDAVQAQRLPRFHHRHWRQDLAHRDRGAQHGHSGRRRHPRGIAADPSGRLGHHRRRRGRGDRQPLADHP